MTATDKAAAVLFIVACLAELGGVILIVREARRAADAIRRYQHGLEVWQGNRPPLYEVHEQRAPVTMGDLYTQTHSQMAVLQGTVPELLDARVRVATAALLLVLGIVAGTVGNFLTL
ncbi:hypothetical protein [Modestobacter sp. VKM Ac-2978]|uniref:hypothetical protein n=1 Tax=Modestobacter sp. VKM Ac-2978 TaxID=3004132 RepID=UPI0022AA1C34|nr:hypothetical protein [Modestobacter sp. VKM Ac-2978]MCZ2850003.1 hypothetical protein [Modestobacter sp. VKM Ac-2978]